MKYASTKEELLLSLINRETPRAYDQERAICVYDQRIHGGCAIGCQVEPKLAEELNNDGSGIEGDADRFDEEENQGLYSQLPDRLKSMGSEFLHYVQTIHDNKENYIHADTGIKAKDGLIWSNNGRREINTIINKYNLKINQIQKIVR